MRFSCRLASRTNHDDCVSVFTHRVCLSTLAQCDLIWSWSRSTPKGEKIKPAIALSLLGYGEDVNRLSEAWRHKIGKNDQNRAGKTPNACPLSTVYTVGQSIYIFHATRVLKGTTKFLPTGVCLPPAAASLLESESGFGKDRPGKGPMGWGCVDDRHKR